MTASVIGTLRIIRANGAESVHVLRGHELTIGSSRSAAVCLDDEPNILPEHILVAARPDSCWVSSAASSPLLNEQHQVVAAGYVPWGSRLTLGPCVFELRRVEATPELPTLGPGVSERAGRSGTLQHARFRAPLVAATLTLLCLVAVVAVNRFVGTRHSSVGGLPAQPALFDSTRPCASANPRHRARLAEDAAFARRDRSVFELQDGVIAVRLFAEAQACFERAGDQAAAELMALHEASMRDLLSEKYKLLHIRLLRALQDSDRRVATRCIRHLESLLRHRSESDYVLALRRLMLRLSSTK